MLVPTEPYEISADVLRVQQMQFHAYHGVFQEEQQHGQQFEVDAELYFDMHPAGISDCLDDTIDVNQVYAAVKSVVVGQRFDLLETLAQHICQKLLELFPADAVRVRVRKPAAALQKMASEVEVGVEVELMRMREK